MPNYNGFPATSYQPQDQFNYQYQPTLTTPNYNPRYWQYQNTTAVPSYNQNVQQPVNSAMIWVQGEAGAKAYMVPNNTTVALWDSEEQTIYIKSVDQNGKPSMTILDYVDRNASEDQQIDISLDDYVTKEQFDEFNENVVTKDQLKNLSSQIQELQQKLNGYSKANNSRKETTRSNGKSPI